MDEKSSMEASGALLSPAPAIFSNMNFHLNQDLVKESTIRDSHCHHQRNTLDPPPHYKSNEHKLPNLWNSFPSNFLPKFQSNALIGLTSSHTFLQMMKQLIVTLLSRLIVHFIPLRFDIVLCHCHLAPHHHYTTDFLIFLHRTDNVSSDFIDISQGKIRLHLSFYLQVSIYYIHTHTTQFRFFLFSLSSLSNFQLRIRSNKKFSSVHHP